MRELGKNEKRIGLYILILCNFILMPFYSTRAASKEEGIQTAFEASGAYFAELNVHGHAAMDHQFMDVQEATQWCWKLAEKLKLENGQLESRIEEDFTQVWITGKVKEGSTVTLQIQSQQYEQLGETHIMIDFYDDQRIPQINDWTKRLRDLLKSYGKTNITTCLVGTFDGNLDIEERQAVLKRVMQSLEAKEVEGYKEGNVMSIVGYSSKVKEWIGYGGNRVNIHLAMRYKDYEDKTYLWMGTPLITVGY